MYIFNPLTILEVPPSFVQWKLEADKEGIVFARLKRQTASNKPNSGNEYFNFVYSPWTTVVAEQVHC